MLYVTRRHALCDASEILIFDGSICFGCIPLLIHVNHSLPGKERNYSNNFVTLHQYIIFLSNLN